MVDADDRGGEHDRVDAARHERSSQMMKIHAQAQRIPRMQPHHLPQTIRPSRERRREQDVQALAVAFAGDRARPADGHRQEHQRSGDRSRGSHVGVHPLGRSPASGRPTTTPVLRAERVDDGEPEDEYRPARSDRSTSAETRPRCPNRPSRSPTSTKTSFQRTGRIADRRTATRGNRFGRPTGAFFLPSPEASRLKQRQSRARRTSVAARSA